MKKSKTNGFSLSFDVGESNVVFLKYGLLAKIRQISHLGQTRKNLRYNNLGYKLQNGHILASGP